MADRIADPWGERTPYARGEAWPVRVDVQLADGLDMSDVDRWVQSASLLHSNGDAMDIAVKDGRIAGVRGRARDRVNHGRLDPKDLFGWQANHHPDRLTRPLVREGGELVESDWETAMGRIVERSRALLDGPGGWGRFGFYTSGQLFLEEYYTLAVIGKAGIGTPHMDGNTRLCTATAAAALKASFGSDGQPGSYTDVDHCDTLALWGAQRRRDAGGAVDAHARPAARTRPATARGRRPARHPGRARGGRAPAGAGRHEPGVDERHPARADRARLDRRGLHRRPYARVRRCWPRPSSRTRSTAWRRPAASTPARSQRRPRSSVPASACSRPCSRASTSPTRRRRPPARSTTCTCCAGCSGGRAPACSR